MTTMETTTSTNSQIDFFYKQLQCTICYEIMDPLVMEAQCCQVLTCGLCALRCKVIQNRFGEIILTEFRIVRNVDQSVLHGKET